MRLSCPRFVFLGKIYSKEFYSIKKAVYLHPNLLKVKSRDKKEEFKLRISGVERGKHSFSIDCDNAFFEIAEIPDLHEGDVKLQIEMDISDKIVTLDFHFKGYVTLPCDRCMEPVNIDLDFTDNLIVKLMPWIEEPEEEDNLWIVNENTYELDLFHFVYESISLALPTQILHPDDENGNSTCNPEILKKLEELTPHENTMGDIDPRLAALKDIKLS